MTLADDILTDARDVFYDTTEFAETVNYRPKDGTPAKDVPALIDPTIDLESGSFNEAEILISIPADATVGIAVPVNGDLALIRGRVCRLVRPLDSAPDGTHDLTFMVGDVE